MALVNLLFSDYNHYRRQCRNMAAVTQRTGFTPNDLQPTPERLGALREMAEWCIDRGYDPPLWLFTLFQARVWMYPPQLTKLTPKTHVKRYQKAQKLGFYERRQRARRLAKKEQSGGTYDPNRDLAASVEAIKLVHQKSGCSRVCMESLHTETLGYHPLSAVCRECPLKQQCLSILKASVPFDIIALREGRITAEAARSQAEQHWTQQLTPIL